MVWCQSGGFSICLQCRRPGFALWVGKIPWRWEWQPTLVFLPGEFYGQRSLARYCPWGCKELDMTEQLTLARLIHYSFLNPSETITFENYFSASVRCTENCTICSRHCSTEWTPFSTTTLDLMSHNQCFKSWMKLRYEVLPDIYLISRQSTSSSSILTTFAGKMLPQSAGGRKCFPRVHWILKHGFLCYRNKQTFLVGKNVLICSGPYFD